MPETPLCDSDNETVPATPEHLLPGFFVPETPLSDSDDETVPATPEYLLRGYFVPEKPLPGVRFLLNPTRKRKLF